ncbi:MAG: protoheme IX farnesyltransferase [Deltaproteobacteria bacterium]|nr:protoheme IX farnesyltransferase [Deltaproteobacteria bacterium]
MHAYLELTKPRISLLFAITGGAALLLEGTLTVLNLNWWWLCFALFCVGGSANGFNQYLERDLDAQMERTSKKRPLPLKKISPKAALVFCWGLGVLGCGLLLMVGNSWALVLGIFTIFFYSVIYTLYLKPRTPYNIVIGGIAGAMAPLIAWIAISETLSWEAWLLFFIIFMWTPPHFWALALHYQKDYEKISLPMLNVVKGIAVTKKQIFLYSLTLLPLTLLLLISPLLGWIFGMTALVGGVLFIFFSYRLYGSQDVLGSYPLFGYSILYLLLLFSALMIDASF